MTLPGIFLADGPSDLPLSRHLEAIAAAAGVDLAITSVDPDRLSGIPRTVEARLRFLLKNGVDARIAFVHRDAESQDPAARRTEILNGATAAGLTSPVVPVVPIRMTEAWLLLDENAIRRVAGNPRGTTPLGLPTASTVERVADAKATLRAALLAASELSGRRKKQFVRDFGRHRALLIERLDPLGPVSTLSAWQQIVADMRMAVSNLLDDSPT
jgi:hypothetical protein